MLLPRRQSRVLAFFLLEYLLLEALPQNIATVHLSNKPGNRWRWQHSIRGKWRLREGLGWGQLLGQALWAPPLLLGREIGEGPGGRGSQKFWAG